MNRSRTMPAVAVGVAAADDVDALILEGVGGGGIPAVAVTWRLYGSSEEWLKMRMMMNTQH